jgi:hypothetical protein
MERVCLTVRGEDAGTLPEAFHDIDEDKLELCDGDGFAVAVTENHYRWEGTEVTATIVMELADEATCEVTIVVGGGGQGFLGYKMTGEDKEARKIRRRIETFCEQRDLTIEQ